MIKLVLWWHQNSGRPGGATYDSFFKKIFNFYSIHSNHTTQEEDIISNLISMLIYDENKKCKNGCGRTAKPYSDVCCRKCNNNDHYPKSCNTYF